LPQRSKAAETVSLRDVTLPLNKQRASPFTKGGGKISRPVVDAFLKQCGHTPKTLLVGWRASGIDEYLAEAIAQFPDAPEVALAVLSTELSPEDRATWVERSKQSAPANALANFYAAIAHLRDNDVGSAAREIAEAAGKTQVDDYYNAAAQEREALLRAAGWTPLEARTEAVFGAELLTTTDNLSKLARAFETEQEAGIARSDMQVAVARAAEAIMIARAMGQAAGSNLVDQMTAILIERRTLQRLNPAQAGDLLGEPLAARLETLRSRGNELDNLGKLTPNWDTDSEQEIMDFLQVVVREGEFAALRERLRRQPSQR
jgi:hypothetical protein